MAEMSRRLEEERIKKQQEEEDLKKWKQLQEKDLERHLKENAQKMDEKLVQPDLSFLDLAKKGIIEQEQNKKEQAENAQCQEELARKEKIKAAEEMEKDFAEFLNSFIKRGVKYYRRLVEFMKELGEFNLEVEFEDIMKFKPQLGIDLFNDKSRESSLLSVVKKFLGDVSFGDTQDVKWKTQLTINRLPHTIDSVKDILEKGMGLVIEFTDMFGEGHRGSTLAPLTCALFGGFAASIFDGHGMGRTWDGKFTIDSMYVVDKCNFVIAMKPEALPGSDLARFEPRKADLKQLVAHFRPHLACKRKGEPDHIDYPVYFPELCHDIENLTRKELESSWIRDFVLENPALKLPLARHNFVCGTRLLFDSSSFDPALTRVFLATPSDFEEDWRPDIYRSNIHLVKWVYHFDPQRNADGMKGNNGGHDGAKGRKGRAKAPKGKNRSPEGNKERFHNTLRGIITYDRHLEQHAHLIVLVKNIAEVEVFSSMVLVKYIHKTIKLLLNDNLTSGGFKDIWEEYKSLKIRTIDGSELQPGRHLSLWN